MKILISNDDGVQSPGIEALVKALYKNHEVTVAAPAGQQSAKAHAITVGQPLYVDEYKPLMEKYGIKAYGIHGTPADSVKLYLEGILEHKPEKYPELIISGINNGSNLGTDLIYSGTVGAAKEGFIHNIPSLAVSLDYHASISFDTAAEELSKKLPELVAAEDVPRLLNINFPKAFADDYAWYWASQGIRDYENAYIKKVSEDGRMSFVVEGEIIDEGNTPDSDVELCNAGHITVTPIRLKVSDCLYLRDRIGNTL
ncbi:MAG: 5'/3'-nucleotidase SurE [Anaerovibrio sp.]|uniref:5'/3'-nucleotidase SurE n=1 Tax=Anaerovibrio sp. TaxID=1872532 RepID=UPI0025FB6C32|nr:5'/3'-nucleotidase SurE [Anaerovibrio sp.]MCR5175657.1 5'/3'-nucleotidase SurE [Anaerovibrio sp.]